MSNANKLGRTNRPQKHIYHFKVLYTSRGVTDEVYCTTHTDVYNKCGIKRSSLRNLMLGKTIPMYRGYKVEKCNVRVCDVAGESAISTMRSV